MSSSSGERLWGYTVTFVANAGGLQPEDVTIRFGEQFNGQPLPTPDYEAMEALWAARTAHNVVIFNGLKFRCAAHGPRGTRGLGFDVGLTDYKHFLATNAAGPDRVAALKTSAVEAGHDPHAFLANPIGIDVVCRTADGYLLFLKRSAQVCEASGTWAAIGGHPEPHMLLLASTGADVARPSAAQVFAGHRQWLDAKSKKKMKEEEEEEGEGELVVRELFESVQREVEEELLGVGGAGVSPAGPRLLGTFQAGWVEGKVDVVFGLDLQLDLARVAQVYAEGRHEDAFEHTALEGLTLPQVRAWLDQVDNEIQEDQGEHHEAKEDDDKAVERRKMSPYTRATLDVYLRATTAENKIN